MTDSKAPILDSLPSDPAPPDRMADAYADRLMDELFGGVERALDGDAEALEAIREVSPPPASELTLNFTEGGLPAVFLNSADSELAPLPKVLANIAGADQGMMTQTAAKPWQRFWTVNRALLGAAGLCLAATLALWFQQRQQMSIATSSSVAPAEAPGVSANAEFLEYLRRSLDVISQKAAEATATVTPNASDVVVSLNTGGAAGLPTIGNNVLPPQALNGVPTAPGAINVIERVYVPYPSPQATASYPAPQGVATPGTAASAGATTTAPVAAHILLGVLELGDRSAALFEIDGVSHRVYIGERIGSSGWSLVSVANEEAVVRRNGEVRTLYIGQRF